MSLGTTSLAASQDDIVLLVTTYHQFCNSVVLEDIIVQFRKVIRGIVREYYTGHVPYNDLFQTGVVGLLDAVGKYNPFRRGNFMAYARMRIRGEILDQFRRDNRHYRRIFSLEAADGEHSMDEALGYEEPAFEELLDYLERQSMMRQLRRILRHLSHGERKLLLLYLRGTRFAEIGMTIGCPIGTVKRRMYDIRGTLRQMWHKEGYSLGA